MTNPVACRLFVLVARDVPVALVLRRGPSAWYHLIRWDMEKDRFESGAWMKARIYEERCDLSPDGELFLYFVHQGTRLQTSYTDAWTGLSRAPWLHALVLWPQGTTYGGGGRFVEAREVVVRNGRLVAHPDHPVNGIVASAGDPPWHASTEIVDGADWAGKDHRGNVIFTREGKLFRRVEARDVELADFNGLTPRPVAAPEWARTPLGAATPATRKPKKRGQNR